MASGTSAISTASPWLSESRPAISVSSVASYSPISARSRRRSALYPKMSSGVPAQALELRQQAEGREHPGAENALLQVAGRGLAPRDERRRHAKSEPHPPLELRLHLPAEAPVGVEPGNLVLVLVGEQLVIGAGDRLAEAFAARRSRPFGLARAAHQGAVAAGKRGVLIGPEVGGAALDQRVQPLRLRLLGQGPGLGCRVGDRVGIVRGGPAPAEGALIGLDRDAVERDRPFDGVCAERDQAALVGEP